jgi:hypothetical protein
MVFGRKKGRMMNSELTLIAIRLEQASTPEEVFGELQGKGSERAANLKKVYHQLARIAHPDIYHSAEEHSLAQVAFADLTRWFDQAGEKIRAGIYGETGAAEIILSTATRTYVLAGNCIETDSFNLYPGYFENGVHRAAVTLKIPRDPQDNDLAQTEARILQILLSGKAADKFSAYIPNLIDSFLYEKGGVVRQANIFERQMGWYSLEEVHAAYPGGIDPKDMAWMWRRLLVSLGFAHINGVIHGAVLPKNIWILPEQHGLRLDGWWSAVFHPEETGERIPAMLPEYAGWYPGEVTRQETPVCGTDLDMAAKCMIYLLGSDPIQVSFPNTTPEKIRAFLKGCTLPGKRARPQDAWALKEEFDDLLKRLWGERKFHPFYMR